MWNLFVPDAYIGNLMMFDQVALSKQRVIACDIDNTLIAHDVDVADERAKRFLAYLQERGFQVILVSNNRKARVARFAQSVSLPYVAFAKKPLPFVFHQIKKKMHCQMDEIVLIGDQLLTDVLGAKLAHVFVVLCDPAVKRDLVYTKCNRQIEKWICARLAKKQLFHKGEYYGKKNL
ncbi:YqeG family HAD IIIA-type phosphatase [Massilicoli timonensis]|uniref:YqeG family HAD IIIA-type phosphatase n=1 Tax=Massilicoli timonensis TaxID=2015901 RepID=UPI0030791DBA